MHIKSIKPELKKSKKGFYLLTPLQVDFIWQDKDDILLEQEQRVLLSHDNDWNLRTKCVVVAGVLGPERATRHNLRVILCQPAEMALKVWTDLEKANKNMVEDDPAKMRLLSPKPTADNLRKELDERTNEIRLEKLGSTDEL